MRIREINEGIISDFLGKQVDKVLSKNLGAETAKVFKDTFSQKVENAIKNAISSGLVNPRRPETVSRYLTNLVNIHMKGVKLGDYKDDIEKSINTLSSSVESGNYNNELAKLGELLYSVSVAASGKDMDADISANTDKMSSAIQKMTGSNNSDDLEKLIKDSLTQLWKIDKAKYLDVLKRLQKIKPK